MSVSKEHSSTNIHLHPDLLDVGHHPVPPLVVEPVDLVDVRKGRREDKGGRQGDQKVDEGQGHPAPDSKPRDFLAAAARARAVVEQAGHLVLQYEISKR